MRRVVVVGAGISGLTAAWRLREAAEVVVLEAGDRPGGKVLTTKADGHLLELGPSSIMHGRAELEGLVRDLGLHDQVVEARAAAKRRYICRGGRLLEIPMGPGAFLRTPLLSPLAKLRIFTEPLRSRGPGEESVRSFFRRRLGPQVADRLVDPFVSGVYAGDADRLSMAAAFPKLSAWEQEHGSLLSGMRAGLKARRQTAAAQAAATQAAGSSPSKAQSKTQSKAPSGLFSFREGVSQLTDRLAADLGEGLKTGARVASIARKEDGSWRVNYTRRGAEVGLGAAAVVLACPGPAARELLASLAPPAAEALAEIPYAPVTVRCQSYPAAAFEGQEGFGFLIPSGEREKVLGCLWNSRIFEGRAPADRFLCSAYLGGAREPGLARLEDREQSAVVSELLARVMGVDAAPLQEWAHRWDEAIPQYDLGHHARVERARYAPRTMAGLFLVGAHLGGVSVPDCVASAELEAGRVKEFLDRQPAEMPA